MNAVKAVSTTWLVNKPCAATAEQSISQVNSIATVTTQRMLVFFKTFQQADFSNAVQLRLVCKSIFAAVQ